MNVPIIEKEGRLGLAASYLLQGKFEESKNLLKQKPVLGEYLAYINLKYGNPKEALQEYNKLLSDAVEAESLSLQIRTLHYKGLAYLGMKSIEKAQTTADELKELVQNSLNKKAIRFYQHLIGMMELERGNFSRAIKYKNFLFVLATNPSQFPPADALK